MATAAGGAMRLKAIDFEPGFYTELAIASTTAKGLIIHSLDDELAPAAKAEKMAALCLKTGLMLTHDLGHRRLVLDRPYASASPLFSLLPAPKYPQTHSRTALHV